MYSAFHLPTFHYGPVSIQQQVYQILCQWVSGSLIIELFVSIDISSGVLAGAASCFFAYIGFDGLATAGEEASGICPNSSSKFYLFRSISINSNCNICFNEYCYRMLRINVICINTNDSISTSMIDIYVNLHK